MKKTLYWSYVIRAFIMTFFAMALGIFCYIQGIDKKSISNMTVSSGRRLLADIQQRYPL